jgi:predicted AAA+ superfamily ATPase
MRPQYRTPVGYTEEFIQAHAARLAEQEREQAARDATNAAALKTRLASIEATRDAERKAADAIDEQSIAPEKARVMRDLHQKLSSTPFDHVITSSPMVVGDALSTALGNSHPIGRYFYEKSGYR